MKRKEILEMNNKILIDAERERLLNYDVEDKNKPPKEPKEPPVREIKESEEEEENNMLDGTYFFECICGSDEHTLRFILDKEDHEIYTSIFLGTEHLSWFKRLWTGIKYIFGYKCKYGHFGNWILKEEDIKKLIYICNQVLQGDKDVI